MSVRYQQLGDAARNGSDLDRSACCYVDDERDGITLEDGLGIATFPEVRARKPRMMPLQRVA